jgi:hypothetical protein
MSIIPKKFNKKRWETQIEFPTPETKLLESKSKICPTEPF